MDHGREAARPTTAGSTELGMAGAVQGSQANIGSGTFDGHQLGAAAAPPGIFSDLDLSGARQSSAEFARHVRAVAGGGEFPVAVFLHEHGPGVAYPNIGEFRRQPGPVHVVLAGPQLPDGVVVQVHDKYYGYSALQHRPDARLGVVLADLLPGGVGAVYSGDYSLRPRPSAGHGALLGNLLPIPDGAGHGEVFVGLLPGAAYDAYAYDALQPRLGAGHGEVLVDLLPDGVGHGEAFVGLQPSPATGHVEAFGGRLPAGLGAAFDNSGIFFAQQTLPDGIAGALRVPNLDAGQHDGSVALADDLGAAHANRGMVAEHLRRLLAFAGVGAASVAASGLAAGPGSPAVAFHLFALLLGGLVLVILHVLRV